MTQLSVTFSHCPFPIPGDQVGYEDVQLENMLRFLTILGSHKAQKYLEETYLKRLWTKTIEAVI